MKIQLTLLFIFILATGYAQQLTSPSGGEGGNATYSFSWSMGELVTTTGSGAFVATQGYQQPVYSLQSTLTQDIQLVDGWNNISFYLTPTEPSVESVFATIISNNNLIKVQDFVNNLAYSKKKIGSGWTASFDIDVNQGYYVKIDCESDITLQASGSLINLPYSISLNAGWNNFPYPCQTANSVETVFSELKSSGNLIKVQSQELLLAYSKKLIGLGWTQPFNLNPGQGYMVKLNEAAEITISNPAEKSSVIDPVYITGEFFQPIWTGYGYQPMNIYIVNIEEMGIEKGDEIAVFDGDLCVGSIIYDGMDYPGIVAACDDGIEDNLTGFIPGNKIIIKSYSENSKSIKIWTGEFLSETKDRFVPLETALFKYSKNIEVLSSEDKMVCYPNPFVDYTNVEISISTPNIYSLRVYDNTGRLVHTAFEAKQLKQYIYYHVIDKLPASTNQLYVVLKSDKSAIIRKILRKTSK